MPAAAPAAAPAARPSAADASVLLAAQCGGLLPVQQIDAGLGVEFGRELYPNLTYLLVSERAEALDKEVS